MHKEDQTLSRETYVQLARLAHESFEQRRSYEWKMHFGLWLGIAAAVYVLAIKEKFAIFDSNLEGTFIGFLLGAMYILHFVMVTRGHWEDKKRKHYYMARAEGQDDAEFDKYQPKSFLLQACWVISYWSFTCILIYYAIRLLLKVPTPPAA